MVLRLLAESFLYNLSGDTPRRLATDLSQAIWWSPGAAWRSTPTRAATQRRSDWRCQGTPRLIPIVTNNVHSVELATRPVRKRADIKFSASTSHVINGPADKQGRSACAACG